MACGIIALIIIMWPIRFLLSQPTQSLAVYALCLISTKDFIMGTCARSHPVMFLISRLA